MVVSGTSTLPSRNTLSSEPLALRTGLAIKPFETLHTIDTHRLAAHAVMAHAQLSLGPWRPRFRSEGDGLTETINTPCGSGSFRFLGAVSGGDPTRQSFFEQTLSSRNAVVYIQVA